MSEKKATLHYDNQKIELPLTTGTESETAIDISTLRAKTGLITIDAGYKNTGSCKSSITFLDGEKGILRYRGYAIEDLASQSSFLEVVYLLIFGELPTKPQLDKFYEDIIEVSYVNEDIKTILGGFPRTAHPMGVLASITHALIGLNPDTMIADTEEDMYNATVKLLGKFPILVGWVLNHKKGKPLCVVNPDISYTDNIINLMFGEPGKAYEPNPIIVDAFNKLLILHADHEQNCSTSTVRIVGSSKAALFASVAAGIAALWGPLHGGANQAVIKMLESISEDGGNTEKYLAKAKDKNDSFRLMGFGHRVYKNFDPRAKIIKRTADELLAQLGIEDAVLDIAKHLEYEALHDSYFVERNLYPNVDFYSGIIYRALGIPVDMFTVMFALGRLPGWIAQWREMRLNGEPIGRPRQVYVGENHRVYSPIPTR